MFIHFVNLFISVYLISTTADNIDTIEVQYQMYVYRPLLRDGHLTVIHCLKTQVTHEYNLR